MFKNIKLYKIYRSLVKKYSKDLFEKFGVEIDGIGRMYTVIHVTDESDKYGPKDGPKIIKYVLQNWLKKFDEFLLETSLKELTYVEELTELDPNNYLLIIKFKFLNISKIMINTYVIGAILGSFTLLGLIISIIFKLLIL